MCEGGEESTAVETSCDELCLEVFFRFLTFGPSFLTFRPSINIINTRHFQVSSHAVLKQYVYITMYGMC